MGLQFFTDQLLPTDADLKSGPGQGITLTVDYSLSVVSGLREDEVLRQSLEGLGGLVIGQDFTPFTGISVSLCIGGTLSASTCSGTPIGFAYHNNTGPGSYSTMLPQSVSGATEMDVRTVYESEGGTIGTAGIFRGLSAFSFDAASNVPEPASLQLCLPFCLLLIVRSVRSKSSS